MSFLGVGVVVEREKGWDLVKIERVDGRNSKYNNLGSWFYKIKYFVIVLGED